MTIAAASKIRTDNYFGTYPVLGSRFYRLFAGGVNETVDDSMWRLWGDLKE
jgi:hypothetical protein